MKGRKLIKVSIIMPSLNVIGYIEKALESVRNQTLADIEIICIDAGSSDGTWDCVRKAASEDDRIIAVRSPIRSYGYQVNMGLDMARGEYVGILETDDYVAETMYEELYRAAKDEKLDYVKCDYSTYLTAEDSLSGRDNEGVFTERRISTSSFFYENVFTSADCPETVIDDWYLWNGIYRADFLKKNQICFSETPGAAFQDIGFLHKVAVAAERVKYLKRSLYRYCVDREGASSNSNRVLEFIRQEYGRILEGKACANMVGGSDKVRRENESRDCSTDKKEAVLLYRRMARSYVRACMDSTDEVLGERTDICDWFRKVLCEAEDQGYIREEDQPVSLRSGFRLLLDNSVDAFVAYRNERGRAFEEFLRLSSENEPVVIYGCGVYGREALGVMRKYDIEPAFFMDRDEQLWGLEIEGIAVISPDRIAELPEDTRYLVANEKYADEIVRRIKNSTNNPSVFLFTSELVYTEAYKRRRK